MPFFTIQSEEYQNTKPFPYMKQDNFLDISFAKSLQEEILSLPDSMWDRYDNPFEQKYTLRDKFNFPPLLQKLFQQFESSEFVSELSSFVGQNLLLDPTRNFWGVHKYDTGDSLDIHVDAGLHPQTKQKKQVTIGLYLSEFWEEGYGCELEIWKGTNASEKNPLLSEKVESITPSFNRFILFTCNDYSWHGNPVPCCGPDEAKRIFVTISYLSENYEDQNKRVKAFFIARPNDPPNPEKDKMRLLRADPERYKDIYRV